MTNAIVRVFDGYDNAQQARAALLADGFDEAAVSLTINNDEAGPVEGNFYVGNTPTESQHHRYDNNYANIEQRSQCLLTVHAPNLALKARAEGILAGFGARDPDPAARFLQS